MWINTLIGENWMSLCYLLFCFSMWQFLWIPYDFRWNVADTMVQSSAVRARGASCGVYLSLRYCQCYCLLLLISILWHRQAIFESKGDKLSSSAERRSRTHQGLRHQIASRLNAHWQTDWAIEDQAKNLELDSPSLWSASIQPTWSHSRLAFAPGSGDIHVCCC